MLPVASLRARPSMGLDLASVGQEVVRAASTAVGAAAAVLVKGESSCPLAPACRVTSCPAIPECPSLKCPDVHVVCSGGQGAGAHEVLTGLVLPGGALCIGVAWGRRSLVRHGEPGRLDAVHLRPLRRGGGTLA